MWHRLSLFNRLSLGLSGTLFATLAAASMMLMVFSALHLVQERQPIDTIGQQIGKALNDELARQDDPVPILRFAAKIGEASDSNVYFRPLGAPGRPPILSNDDVPGWFMALMGGAAPDQLVPIEQGGKLLGHIVIRADSAPDLEEKWVAFLAMVGLTALLALVNFVVVKFLLPPLLKPLESVAAAVNRINAGDYSVTLEPSGSPEIAGLCETINTLAETLRRLQQENAGLIRRMVALQDEERSEISKELHDELGPLLFSLRANTKALKQAHGGNEHAATIMSIAEQLQLANRRILDHMRPMPLQELGLTAAIESLIGNFRDASRLAFTHAISPAADKLPERQAIATYRVVQEGLTNVMRHAKASRAHVGIAIGADVVITVEDNGTPGSFQFGRGLTGMRERARALGGDLDVIRRSDGTSLRVHFQKA